MQLRIDRDALDWVFRTLLTCGCPVTDEEERAIYDLLEATPVGKNIDYSRVLAVFKPNANTVFRRLGEFAGWQAPIGINEYVVNREHVIRHFASSFHWNHIVAEGLNGAYKKVIHIPTWFLGHMLLPVRLTSVHSGRITASYEYSGGEVVISNIFAPDDYEPRPKEIWAIHFAGLLDRLNPKEQQIAILMTEINPLLVQFRNEVKHIDYANFERHGDYFTFCKNRYRKYYG